jgi:hypothetical protein
MGAAYWWATVIVCVQQQSGAIVSLPCFYVGTPTSRASVGNRCMRLPSNIVAYSTR